MTAIATYPAAAVVAVRTDGLAVNQVSVRCPFCRGVHVHAWHREPDGLRDASCVPFGAIYRITIDTKTRLEAMRTDFSTPDGVVGLIPLHLSYCFEVDGPDQDVVGIVLDTTLGRFAVWLPLPSAVGLAGQLVGIAENADQLRIEYLQRLETGRQDQRTAMNTTGVV
jgi:hypothetical protein